MGLSLQDIVGVVLAGGASRRMGADKALLSYRGRPLVEWVAEALTRRRGSASAGGLVQVVVAGRGRTDLDFLGLPVLQDPPGMSGPLAGLAAGLAFTDAAARAGIPAAVLAVPCDNPFLEGPVLDRLLEAGRDNPSVPAVVWQDDERLQPLPGLYRAAVLPALHEELAQGRGSLHGLLLRLPGPLRLPLPPDVPAFRPMNHPDEYRRLTASAEGPGSPEL